MSPKNGNGFIHKLTEPSITQIQQTFCLTDKLFEAQTDKSNTSSCLGSVPALLSEFSFPCSLSGNTIDLLTCTWS